MTILPVLDLLDGLVVRGVAGRRSEYRPLQSRLAETAAPLDVARALRREFGFRRLYVADLDGILHHRANDVAVRQLIDDGFSLLVDAGTRDIAEAQRMNESGAELVIGLESTSCPEQVAQLASVCEAATFSLDLQNGVPLLSEGETGWRDNPREIVRQVVGCGISRLIVLDLADVGMRGGARTGALCEAILAEFPQLIVTCGGGVRGIDDLHVWQSLGASQVLVASALHDGRLSAAELADFAAG